MFEGIYSHIQKKPIRRESQLTSECTLDEILKLSNTKCERGDFVRVFVNELKRLLELESAYDLVEGLFEIESKITKILEQNANLNGLDFSDFYRDLAPLLLQKFWERRKNPQTEETIDRLFLETIHIAIEEEIYIWQEKIQ